MRKEGKVDLSLIERLIPKELSKNQYCDKLPAVKTDGAVPEARFPAVV